MVKKTKQQAPAIEKQDEYQTRFRVVYFLSLMALIMMHMIVSNVDPIALITQIWQRPDGILISLGQFGSWAWSFIFSTRSLYLFGLVLILEFWFFPHMIRYKYIQFSPGPLLSITSALFLLFVIRFMGIID
ncbi:MAG: hypothetical protein ACNA8K_12865 [Cyclonatronaceae bacterium]